MAKTRSHRPPERKVIRTLGDFEKLFFPKGMNVPKRRGERSEPDPVPKVSKEQVEKFRSRFRV